MVDKEVNKRYDPIYAVLKGDAQALAVVAGSPEFPNISGRVRFYQTNAGVLVYAEIMGLPSESGKCADRVFGFHIHEGERCGGRARDWFADTRSHYNPGSCGHPFHAGDLPPLFGNNGFAFCVVLTNRFAVKDIIGRTVVIHDKPDDFTTQPSGGSGVKSACGEIKRA